MNEREVERRIRDLEEAAEDLRRSTGNIPVRFPSGGGGGEVLPPGKGIYKVLQFIDDLDPGTPGWDYPKIH